MADWEKVIRGLGCLAGEYDMESNKCAGCVYRECATFAHCIGEIARDALSLLKAQEPIEPVETEGDFICGNQGFECGVVGRRNRNTGKIEEYCNYCPMCGKKVKWDAAD